MLKKYIKFYLKTLTTEPMNWLFAFLWFSMVICAILIEFTTVVTYEGTMKEFIYLSLAMFVATIINAIVSWRFEQENIETIEQEELSMETPRIKNGDIVQHFKRETVTNGDPNAYLYKVIDVNAREVDNYTRVVVYEALYDNGGIVKHGNVFVRNYEEFMSEVDRNKYPDIKQKYRFEVV